MKSIITGLMFLLLFACGLYVGYEIGILVATNHYEPIINELKNQTLSNVFNFTGW
jgi:hypothetical protein